MNTQEKNENALNCAKETYEKPSVEIIEMEMESPILQGSGGNQRPGNGYDGW